jgi:tetratricopeptide (TPR) repeat protein
LFLAVAQAQPGSNLEAVEKALEKQVKVEPSAENWQKLGLSRYLGNRFDTAIPAFREAVRLNPRLWTSHLFLGISLYRTNEFPLALKSLLEADRLAPAVTQGRDDIEFWLGASYIAQNQPWAGLQALERLLARNPDHKEALHLAARTYADVSANLWNDVAERHFDTPAGLEVHGHALESESNWKGAMQAYRDSIRLAPRRAGPRRALGRLLLAEGNAREALRVLQEELKLAPADEETRNLLAAAAERAK